jgi:hypothetical protein
MRDWDKYLSDRTGVKVTAESLQEEYLGEAAKTVILRESPNIVIKKDNDKRRAKRGLFKTRS